MRFDPVVRELFARFIILTRCQIFLVSPEFRHLVTNRTTDKIDQNTTSIMTLNDLVGRDETRNLTKIQDKLNNGNLTKSTFLDFSNDLLTIPDAIQSIINLNLDTRLVVVKVSGETECKEIEAIENRPRNANLNLMYVCKVTAAGSEDHSTRRYGLFWDDIHIDEFDMKNVSSSATRLIEWHSTGDPIEVLARLVFRNITRADLENLIEETVYCPPACQSRPEQTNGTIALDELEICSFKHEMPPGPDHPPTESVLPEWIALMIVLAILFSLIATMVYTSNSNSVWTESNNGKDNCEVEPESGEIGPQDLELRPSPQLFEMKKRVSRSSKDEAGESTSSGVELRPPSPLLAMEKRVSRPINDEAGESTSSGGELRPPSPLLAMEKRVSRFIDDENGESTSSDGELRPPSPLLVMEDRLIRFIDDEDGESTSFDNHHKTPQKAS